MMFPTDDEVTDGGWSPKLIEVEKWKSEPGDVGNYWRQFGWNQLEVPDDCPQVAMRMIDLGTHFLDRYAFRRLGRETMEEWQIALQYKFDMFVYKYERAYALYEAHATQIAQPIKQETTARTYEDHTTGEATGSANSTNKSADTPDTSINMADNWGDRVDKATNESTSNQTGSGNGTENITHKYEGDAVARLNSNIENWMNIDKEFLERFEDLFLNVFDY